ncbi:hypothetical protein [Francisella sp. 19S2-10]|uniref:hypothetical protein n=1 Tax=unclassified Francisella TaxID=2610885 RepID=UPI003FA5C021
MIEPSSAGLGAVYSTETVCVLSFARVNEAGLAEPVAPSIAGTLTVRSALSPTTISRLVVDPH